MMMNFMNGQPAGDVYRDADCGRHFNDYVRENRTADFDYDPYNGGCTRHDDLWGGRRLRIKLHPDAGWREARVVHWEEYLVGPFAPVARWNVSIAFTDIDEDGFGLGDVVEIRGLTGAPQHNGKVGSIVSGPDGSNDGRYGVRYGGSHHLAVKPANLRRVGELSLAVHRCNVEGGGVLIVADGPQLRPSGPFDRLSFEWLDEAVPRADLLTDDPPPSFRPDDVTVDMTEDEIGAELERNTRELEIPSNRCDGEYLKRFSTICNDVARRTQEGGDAESTADFKRWLLTTPIEFWGPQNHIKFLCERLGVEAAEVLVAHVDGLRGTEPYKRFARGVLTESKTYGRGEVRLSGFSPERESALEDADNFHDVQMLHLTEITAVKYEEVGEYHDAIRLYKKNLQHVPSLETSADIYGASLNNLALAQKRAGLFRAALKSYNKAVECGVTAAIDNRRRLQNEIDEWIGSSGQVTPRLDE